MDPHILNQNIVKIGGTYQKVGRKHAHDDGIVQNSPFEVELINIFKSKRSFFVLERQLVW